MQPERHESKVRLIEASTNVIRAKGYAATTVDDICHRAGVTKGSFFHHFKSKDDLAVAAALHFGAMSDDFFAAATYRKLDDPRDRLLGYLNFRGELLRGELPDYTCLLGTLIQETYDTHPHIRAACDRGLSSHVAMLTRDLQAARDLYAPGATWSAESVAEFIQAALQGGFIFAKAKQSPDAVRDVLEHLRRYLGVLFGEPREKRDGRREGRKKGADA